MHLFLLNKIAFSGLDIHNGLPDFEQIGWITFFLSSVLDNLTSTIVMVSLLRKLVKDPEQRRYTQLRLNAWWQSLAIDCKDSAVEIPLI